MSHRDLIFIFFLTVFQACGQEKYPLTHEDLKLLPYKGNEVLIFKSGTGEYDTIKLKSYKLGYPDAPTRLKHYAQIASIHGNFTDPNLQGKNSRYLYGRLFELKASTPEREAVLGIFLKAKSAIYYGPSYFTKSQMDKLERIELRFSNRLLNDVIVIQAEANNQFKSRNNFVTSIYWSLSEGIVKYEKSSGETWTKVN